MHSDLNAVESSISSPFFGSFSLLIISLIFPGKIYKNLFFFFFFSELLCKGGRSPMAVLWVTAFMSSHLLYCSHRGGVSIRPATGLYRPCNLWGRNSH